MQDALQNNNIEKISGLIKSGIDINSRDIIKKYKTPLIFAYETCTYETISWLLENGADLNLDYSSILAVLIRRTNIDVKQTLTLFIKHGYKLTLVDLKHLSVTHDYLGHVLDTVDPVHFSDKITQVICEYNSWGVQITNIQKSLPYIDLSYVNHAQDTFLHYICNMCIPFDLFSEIVEKCITHVNKKNAHGELPIHKLLRYYNINHTIEYC